MAKTEKTRFIERVLWANKNEQGLFGCFEVTIGWFGKEIVDFITLISYSFFSIVTFFI